MLRQSGPTPIVIPPVSSSVQQCPAGRWQMFDIWWFSTTRCTNYLLCVHPFVRAANGDLHVTVWPCDTVTLPPTTNIIISSCCYTGPGHAALAGTNCPTLCIMADIYTRGGHGHTTPCTGTALAGPKVRQLFSKGEQNTSFILRFRYFEVAGSPLQLVSPVWWRREHDTDTHPICCPTRLIITVV